MSEAFELVDEAAAVAFGVLGVAAVEELFAELVVGTPWLRTWWAAVRILWPVATVALACPRGLLIR